MPYIYEDEDNAPMNEEAWDKDGHNPTVYLDKAEMRYYESGQARQDMLKEAIPFTEHEDGCWNCVHFDWNREACSAGWNNMDESYYNPDRDDRNYDDWCEMHETDPDAKWEDVFGNE